MKHSLRYFITAGIFLLVIAFGLAAIQAQWGSEIALGTGLLLLSLPSVLNPPSHVLGAVADPATAARNTEERPGDFVYLPLAADTKIFQGTLVARDAAGRAVPASDTAGLRVVGRAEQTVDNTGGDADALSINIKLGVFLFDNSADDPVLVAHVGKLAEVEADNTVAIDSTNHVTAGRIVEVSSLGVWVDTRHAFYGPKTVVALTSTNGVAAAASADLAALAAEAEKAGDDVRALHDSLYG